MCSYTTNENCNDGEGLYLSCMFMEATMSGSNYHEEQPLGMQVLDSPRTGKLCVRSGSALSSTSLDSLCSVYGFEGGHDSVSYNSNVGTVDNDRIMNSCPAGAKSLQECSSRWPSNEDGVLCDRQVQLRCMQAEFGLATDVGESPLPGARQGVVTAKYAGSDEWVSACIPQTASWDAYTSAVCQRLGFSAGAQVSGEGYDCGLLVYSTEGTPLNSMRMVAGQHREIVGRIACYDDIELRLSFVTPHRSRFGLLQHYNVTSTGRTPYQYVSGTGMTLETLNYVCKHLGYLDGVYSFTDVVDTEPNQRFLLDDLVCDSSSSDPPGLACTYEWRDSQSAEDFSAIALQCSWGQMALSGSATSYPSSTDATSGYPVYRQSTDS